MPVERYPIVPFEPAPSWRYKVHRANEHLAAFRSEVEWFKETGLYEPLSEYNTETGRHRFIVGKVHPVPIQLGMIAGDIAHNLRAALDHLWCAILRSHEQPVTRRSQFPIFDTKPRDAQGRTAWRKQVGTGLPDELIAQVETLQPYATPEGVSIKRHPLYVLNELDRRDKHFAINLVAVYSRGTSLQIGDRFVTVGAPVKVEAGAVLADFGPEEIGHQGEIELEMEVKFGSAAQIVFEEAWGEEGMPADAVLLNVLDNVVRNIPPLERFCPVRPASRHDDAP